MAVISVYSDEYYCNKNTFRLGTLIWGNSENCYWYNDQIKLVVQKNKKILGENFREFHGVKLKAKNWRNLGVVYEEVIKALVGFIKDRKLGMLIYIISDKRYKDNAGWLKDIVIKGVTDRESQFGKLFGSLTEKDLPALYHSMDALFPLLYYRDKIGKEGDEFELYPDPAGKILWYRDTNFAMSGTLPISLPFEFYDIIKILGDSFIKALPQMEFPGWTSIDQSLKSYRPTASEESYLIQACDIISHFTANHFKVLSGSVDETNNLKSELISKYVNMVPTNAIFKESFRLQDGELVCINEALWGKITIK